ncbi:MAG: flavin reductase family protein [Campylobacterales bacterium]|nr:flavin reductase family protein [Campylobacterales bacterium]
MFTTTKILNSQCHSQPRLTALLACGNNFMPMSWHMPVSKAPFRYAVAIRPENESYDLVHALGHFSINFMDYSYFEAMEKAGSQHGGDKFALTGLTPKKADAIKSTLIEEAYMIYECRVVEIVNFGDHDIFIADVLCIHNKESKDVLPTLFLGRGYYETISQSPKRVERD